MKNLDASTYLDSLQVSVLEAEQASIGRLALSGVFSLDGKRGAIINPKRGGISERYLGLLAEAGYDLVIVDSSLEPSIYAKTGTSLLPTRALPVSKGMQFPTAPIWETWTSQVCSAAGPTGALTLATSLITRKFDDENAGGLVFNPDRVQGADEAPIENLGGHAGIIEEPFRKAVALLSGYRTLPQSARELASLLSAVTSLGDGRQGIGGLDEGLGRLMEAAQRETSRLLISTGLGAEAACLFQSRGDLWLPSRFEPLADLLRRLMPEIRPFFGDPLQVSPAPEHATVVLVPPYGTHVEGRDLHRFELQQRAGKPLARIPRETLLIEQALAATADLGVLFAVLPEGLLSSAGQSHVRQWLLQQARLLAVVSLPAGGCTKGSGVKCSLVVVQKRSSIPDDYPILMMDLEPADLDGEEPAAALREFLDRELTPCD